MSLFTERLFILWGGLGVPVCVQSAVRVGAVNNIVEACLLDFVWVMITLTSVLWTERGRRLYEVLYAQFKGHAQEPIYQ